MLLMIMTMFGFYPLMPTALTITEISSHPIFFVFLKHVIIITSLNVFVIRVTIAIQAFCSE